MINQNEISRINQFLQLQKTTYLSSQNLKLQIKSNIINIKTSNIHLQINLILFSNRKTQPAINTEDFRQQYFKQFILQPNGVKEMNRYLHILRSYKLIQSNQQTRIQNSYQRIKIIAKRSRINQIKSQTQNYIINKRNISQYQFNKQIDNRNVKYVQSLFQRDFEYINECYSSRRMKYA
ncbi:unnamed protein product [Paramecium sonneborni]|uniref:Uncharacterized protein n=1 Tax=Paramecium sonneborni TaxID=65129 RepID=A0A8S1RAG2_9CILI|nr:unnamed protein product [Paramecium sonneborni]